MASQAYGPEVQAIMQSVESTTNARVEVVHDPSLSVLATVSMADRGAPIHLIRVRPGPARPDYMIACQCGFILRHYAHPVDQRKGLTATERGRAAIRRHVFGPEGVAERLGLPAAAANDLVSQFVDGLATQLRSVPIALRIDQWIHGTYPGLRPLQAKSFDEQQMENAASLSGKVNAIAPPAIFHTNTAMNAAFALFCDELVGLPLYVLPYRAMGLEAMGRRLLDIAGSGPNGPLHDYDLVSRWASELGVNDWYEWVPLR